MIPLEYRKNDSKSTTPASLTEALPSLEKASCFLVKYTTANRPLLVERLDDPRSTSKPS